jgi:formate dehydrogenase major subunit
MVLELLLADLPELGGHKWATDNAAQPHGELSAMGCAAGRQPCARALVALRREQPAPDLSIPPWRSTSTPASSATAACAPAAKRRATASLAWRPRRAHQHRVRPGRPHGCQQLRGLRRVCAGLPHRRAQPKTQIGSQSVDRQVDSVCPFCGVGCQITYNVRDTRPATAETPEKHRQRQRPQRPGQRRPPLRERPLRLRLRPPPGPPDRSR